MKVYAFHYVKKNFNYYHFDADMFEECIRKLKNKYRIIGLEEAEKLKKNTEDDNIMLTFDDGTKDHYEFVYPVLKKYQVKGVFFLSSNIFENKILDVQLIHSLIEKIGIDELYEDVKKLIKKIK